MRDSSGRGPREGLLRIPLGIIKLLYLMCLVLIVVGFFGVGMMLLHLAAFESFFLFFC